MKAYLRHRNTKAHLRRRRGMALGMTLVFLLGFAVMGASYFTLTTTFSHLANRAYNKTQATALAEAGVHAMFAQVSSSLLTNGVVNTTAIGTTTLTGTMGSSAINDGTFSASVISLSGPTDSDQPYGANGTETTITYTFTVQGVGTAPNGVTSVAQATFSDTQVQTSSESVGTSNAFTFPDAAVVSNGAVSMNGNTATHAEVTVHGAGVSANGVMTGVGNYSVDGPIDIAPGSSYTATVAALGSSPNDYGNAVTELSAPVSFPDSSTISTWMTTYQGEAQEATSSYPSGQTITGTVSSGTINGPAYINGNISLSGNKSLTLGVQSGATSPIVIYVNGNVSLAGNSTLTNNGVILVVTGTVSVSGNGAAYSTGASTNATSGLIDFSSASNAVTLRGNGGDVGLVYAVNGGVTINGNGSLTGSLIAGGTGSSGQVNFTGNAALYYPGGLNSDFTGIPPANQWTYSTPVKYTPTSLSGWLQTR